MVRLLRRTWRDLKSIHRHCEERGDEAIQLSCCSKAGLLRCARNDGKLVSPQMTVAYAFAISSCSG
ncbi:MAG: hypothetical protein DI543_26745 [Bradyrhizobium icense]|nr:MAG: hypothetical protein DI543_26745 [Bradyrhizobium icense]